MKLSELIAHVGDENIQFQNLQQSTSEIRNGFGKKPSTVTFSTDPEKVSQIGKSIAMGTLPDFVGLVVWIPADKLPKTLKPTTPTTTRAK